MTMKSKAPRYEDTVVAVPITVPYVRYSIRGAHWFVARALAGLLEGSGLEKSAIDGLCLSSFTLAPDTAVGVTQHLGLSLRWLDHIPMGGASGIVALRRALRAVQSGDATIVACVAADTTRLIRSGRRWEASANSRRTPYIPTGPADLMPASRF